MKCYNVALINNELKITRRCVMSKKTVKDTEDVPREPVKKWVLTENGWDLIEVQYGHG